MPELANRMEIEADFAAKLSRLSAKHRKELIGYLGNPPDLNNVPFDFWKRVEKEKKQQMALALFLIFAASSDQHTDLWLPGDLRGMAQEAAQDRGQVWSAQRANDLAAQYVLNSQKKLADSISRLNGVDVLGPIPFDVKARGSGAIQVPQVSIDDALLSIFGPARDAGIAATETTGAATAGVHGARGAAEQFGVATIVTWFTERDGRVCPICRPLHGQQMKDWEGALISAAAPGWAIDQIRSNGGPPAHPNCRCYLETKVVKQ